MKLVESLILKKDIYDSVLERTNCFIYRRIAYKKQEAII
jgi:hypothetical protein